MFDKIKEYFRTRKEYNEAKKALTLLIMNQYSDFLEAETEAKRAEKEAYEATKIFSESLNIQELQEAMAGINKIAKSPDLTTEYYKDVVKRAAETKDK